MKYSYVCFKCGNNFTLDRELDTDKPTCNDCFAKLVKIDNVEEYYKFINENQG